MCSWTKQVDGVNSDSFDAFADGGKDEAEAMFMNRERPVHCLSTRFGGVNYRVSVLIGEAAAHRYELRYHATYNPNFLRW